MDEQLVEKGRRVYYQDIVYAVALLIDGYDGQSPGSGIVCGTVDEPSDELQSRVRLLLYEMRGLREGRRRLVEAATSLLAKMYAVEIDPDLGDETDRVFGRFEFEDLRNALGSKEPREEPRRNELMIALAESLSLQSHQAELLNQYDGGRRRTFSTPESWIDRLRETGKLPALRSGC